VELGIAVQPSRQLLMRGSYTYTDARFDDFTVRGESFAGNKIPGVPRHRVQSMLALDAEHGWHATADLEYVSDTPADDRNSSFSPDYLLVGLRLGVRRIQFGSWLLAPHLGISNMFNAEYNSSVVVNAFGGRFFEPGPGRKVWLGASLQLIGSTP
jgi:iron complex outermembrane receptor protein